VNLDAVPWPVRPLDALEGGKIDLLLAPDPHMLPWDAERDELYREGWICAVWSRSGMGERPAPKPLTLSGYAKAEHLMVSPRAHFRTALDDGLSRLDIYRRSRVRVPYFGAALACLPGTELLLTLPASMRALVERDPKLRLLQAPLGLPPLEVWMAWHPRLNDDARHVWLRERMRAVHPAKCLPCSAAERQNGAPFPR